MGQRFIDEMVRHTQEDAPNECCGILAGKDGRVTRLYRVSNVERSPNLYRMDAVEFVRADEEIRESGAKIVGIYHSHTHTEGYPSRRDRRLAYSPEPLYFIVSLQDSARPTVRAFRIRDEGVTEETFHVTADKTESQLPGR